MSRQAGEYQGLSNLIFPENSIRRKPFFGLGGALPENRARPSAGLTPNGEAMLADQFTAAAAAARNTAAVDEIARLTWRAHAEGQLHDAEAEAISEALQGRRAAFATRRTVSPPRPALGLPWPVKRPRSPDHQASLERRRRQAMSGVVPAKIAASFTMAELAVLTVIARQCQRTGVCTLHIDAIAALAGCSRTTVKNALRQARLRGLILVKERRIPGLPSLTNVVTIISKEWIGWLKLGGGVKRVTTTDSHFHSIGANGGKAWSLSIGVLDARASHCHTSPKATFRTRGPDRWRS